MRAIVVGKNPLRPPRRALGRRLCLGHPGPCTAFYIGGAPLSRTSTIWNMCPRRALTGAARQPV